MLSKLMRMLCLFLSLVVGLMLAPGSVLPKHVPQRIGGAKKEGSLVLSWGTGKMGGIEGVRAMEKAFAKTYGINLQFKFSPGPAMPQFASRIIQEARAGQPASSDLFIGSENHVARMSLKKFEWTKPFPHITREMTDWDDRGLVVVSRPPGFTYKTNLVAASQAPQKIEEVR